MNDVLYGDKDFVFTYERREGLSFIHLDINNFNKSSLTRMRRVFEMILLYFDELGDDVIFATTEKDQTLKVWKTVKGWDELVELKQGKHKVGWLGAWYTGE